MEKSATTLSEYIKKTSESIANAGGDPEAVYDSNISDAMITCHRIANEYARCDKSKSPPVPLAVKNKTSEEETYTQFKFSNDVNPDKLRQSVINLDKDNICVTEYGSSVNVEIYIESNIK